MKKLFPGILSILLAVGIFSIVQAKTVADLPCVTESGVAGSVWFFYISISSPIPTSSSIIDPSNYIKVPSDVGGMCDATAILCAICAVPQAGNQARPNLTQSRIQTALANYNFSATLTLDPSGVILERDE